MIEDFRATVAGGATLEADVVIVGCGPVGIALAEEFEHEALDVVVVESGGTKIDPELQSLNEGVVVGLPHSGHFDGRARAIGGTGLLWAGQCVRLDAADFERREWVPNSGWPFDGDTLSPYYARAEEFFGLPSAVYNEENYERSGVTPPRWPGKGLINHFTLYTPAIDIGRHHLRRLRDATTIRVLTHAHVVKIGTNLPGNQVCSVHLRTLDGAEAQLRADLIVLGAGGIENARILLSSRDHDQTGIGNRNGLVGRFFQEHPNAITATVHPTDVADLQNRFRIFYRGSGVRSFPKFALSPALQHRHRVLNCNAHLVFEYPEDSGLNALRRTVHALRRRHLPEAPLHQLGLILRELDQVGTAAIRRFGKGKSPIATPTALRLQCYLEQAPNADSRVCLSQDIDSLGMPRLCVDWRLTDLERKTLLTMTDVVRNEFASAGLGDVRPEPWLYDDGDDWKLRLRDCSHHMGTTRMAATDSDGVVDEDCEVFGVEGLFVAGSSVFPTSGYANPTLTAVALALRLADTLKARIAGLKARQNQPATAANPLARGAS